MTAPLPPLLSVLFEAFRERGWTLPGDGTLIDPDGNVFAQLEDAISAQCFREIAQA